MTTTINACGPDTIEAHGWQIQRGFVYRVTRGDDAPDSLELDSGETVGVGYHGCDLPPCGADYLYQDNRECLVISCESDPADIATVEGFTLERVDLSPGDHLHDGTWEFRVLAVSRDGETILAGKA